MLTKLASRFANAYAEAQANLFESALANPGCLRILHFTMGKGSKFETTTTTLAMVLEPQDLRFHMSLHKLTKDQCIKLGGDILWNAEQKKMQEAASA